MERPIVRKLTSKKSLPAKGNFLVLPKIIHLLPEISAGFRAHRNERVLKQKSVKKVRQVENLLLCILLFSICPRCDRL